MARIGLDKNQINQILEQNGIGSSDVVSAENIRNAIATAIEENNKKIQSEITNYVMKEIDKKLSLRF